MRIGHLVMRQFANGRDEAIEIDRLLKILRCLQALGALGAVVRGGHANDWHVGELWLLQLPPAELVSAHHRHHQVEEDHGGPSVLQRFECLLPVRCCLHHESFGLEEDREHLPQVGMIFNNEDGLHERLACRGEAAIELDRRHRAWPAFLRLAGRPIVGAGV
jgi:hypothetical protein